MMEFFRKLFGRAAPQVQEETATTAPLTDQQIQSILYGKNVQYDLQQLIAASGQSVGKQRELNEDSILAITTTLAGNSGSLPFGLYIVADGMGGHQYGEVASNAAIRTVGGHIMRKFEPYLFSLKSSSPDESLQEIMQTAVKKHRRPFKVKPPAAVLR